MKRYFWIFKWIVVSHMLVMSHAYAGTLSTASDMKSPVRVFHFVLRGVEIERASWMVKEARKEGFNAVQVLLTDGVRLDHAPWQPLPDAWSKEDFLSWVNDVRNQGLEVIPEIKLLTHQEKFYQDRQPGLMFNQSTYDPRKEETYQRVFSLLGEIIEAIHPKAIHIGHDEVAGINAGSKKKWLREGEEMIPAVLFLKDIFRIHDYLKQRHIQMWMWGDMLISPEEFPKMLSTHLHGFNPGYGKPLREKLPRDIVICDWHYFDDQVDFPSLSVMQTEGFRVIGATWKTEKTIRNFSRYGSQHGAYGMMATTWFHVQRKEWDTVDSIIRLSGEIFIKDFPNAK